jgi:hypothetical protein
MRKYVAVCLDYDQCCDCELPPVWVPSFNRTDYPEEDVMSARKSKSRTPLSAKLREAAYIFAFPLFMLIWAVQSYA